MRRKLAAITFGLFMLGTFAFVNPVQAHFTLGDLTGTYRYHVHDFDPHVPGVIGYVWPGGGLNTYNGFPNFANINQPPGYQSPYPGGNPPQRSIGAAGTAPLPSWYQLEGDAYAPFGAVLVGSTGDLIFALNATQCTVPVSSPNLCPTPFRGRWDTLMIMIPPPFSVPDNSQIVTTITNDYSGVIVTKIGPYDRYVPGWTMVAIMADAGMTGRTQTTPYYDHQFVDFSAAGEWYYVRINGVTAPSVAGRYFFKIMLSKWITPTICGEEGTGTNIGPLAGESCSEFIPTENWPVLLVKGEIDPAIITGTIRYAGYNQTLYNQPVGEAGRVYAKMTTRLDPYTGQTRPDLPLIDAQAYFNATARGHYEVEGVAPGVYDLYASAAGYPQTLIASKITVLKGQSLHFDGYLQPGPVIHGNVFTKHQFGDEPWPGNQTYSGSLPPPAGTYPYYNNPYIKIELYDGPTLNHIPSAQANMVSWSPLPCIAGGQELYYNAIHAGFCGDPRLGGAIAFPWHEYVPTRGYFSGASPTAFNFYQVSTGAGDGSQINKLTQDPQGVGPPQHWYVPGGSTTPFHFEFGVKAEYGAPRDLDGMVPQMYATWVNGLTPGRYYARAWVFRYVQAALDGSTFQEYYFDVTPNEWAGDVTLPIDLRLSSWVNKTVYYHNVINGITTDPIDTGAGMMAGVLVDANGVVWSYNQTLLGYKGLYTNGAKSGWGSNAFSISTTIQSGNDLDKAKLNKFAIETGRANLQFWGWNDTWSGENYGIPSGTYMPHVYTLGYVERGPIESVSVTLSGNPTSISDHMYRGAGFNITVFSIDWQRPRVSRVWVWGNAAGYTASGPATSCGALGCPGPENYKGMVGQEIDVGIYNNGKLVDYIGDEVSQTGATLPDTVLTSCLFQAGVTTEGPSTGTATNSSAQLCGGGWEASHAPLGVTPNTAGNNYKTYQGNANDAYFGQELTRTGFVGGFLSLPGNIRLLSFSIGKVLFGPAVWMPRYVTGDSTATYMSSGCCALLYPSALPGGLQYDLRGYTYGYVQDKMYSVYASSGQVADIKINLMIGVNVTLDILFKKEHIISPTSANMSARVRLFDDSGNLVGEWMSSEGTYVTGGVNGQAHGFARAADGTYQYPFGNLQPVVISPTDPNTGKPLDPLNTYNYLPGGTTLLHVLMAGLPTVPPGGQDHGPSNLPSPPLNYVPKFWYFGDPSIPTASSTYDFEIPCMNSPGSASFAPAFGYYPNYGIAGSPTYKGGYTAEVDFVNWYANNTITTYVPPGGTQQYGGRYYPPIAGLLMGESYHIIPGSAAKSGISLTEDLALNKGGLSHSLTANHLGPYSQQGVWQISNAPNSGEASAIFEVDLNGLVSGNALAFTWSNEFRPLSWALVSVVPASGKGSWNFYTYDGVYQAYLTPGQYKFTISMPGIASQTFAVSVGSGQTGTGYNMYLEESNIPIPEFSTITIAIAAFSALAASLYVLRRKSKLDRMR